MSIKTDFLVIGSGLAGLSMALKAAAFGKVTIVTKSEINDSNPICTKGGIAAAINDGEDFERHINDTLITGAGICNENVVRKVITNAPILIEELINLGANFDVNNSCGIDFEGGHSEHQRSYSKDKCGIEIQRVLYRNIRKNPNITILENHFAIDLITQHHLGEIVNWHNEDTECYGAYVLDMYNQKIKTVLSKCTFMATGGAGNLFLSTTNPASATGDGIAMVDRAKGIIENMEFIQFHPTSLYSSGEKPIFLISDTLRGFGAVLKTIDGIEFMQKYDSRGSLAPRDIVARAIDNELKATGDDFVWLDFNRLDKTELLKYFPAIFNEYHALNIDIHKALIPVIPAAHYMCGGIKVDINARTSIKYLYAAGETSFTGFHGANRLAANSLIESLAYADWAIKDASSIFSKIKFQENISEWKDEGTTHSEETVLINRNLKEVQQIMSKYVGIVRNKERLQCAHDSLRPIYIQTESLYHETKISRPLCELRNLITVAYLVNKHASAREMSVGLHFRND